MSSVQIVVFVAIFTCGRGKRKGCGGRVDGKRAIKDKKMFGDYIADKMCSSSLSLHSTTKRRKTL